MPKLSIGPILAIESSCDDTATAVVTAEGRILAEQVVGQAMLHTPFGGVVPEISARAHLSTLPQQVRAVLYSAGVDYSDLAAVSASVGPGLIGGLVVGSQVAKGIAVARGLRFVPVNHLEAHALVVRLPGLVKDRIPFPYLLLLVSGGHCQCVVIEGVQRYITLGRTLDDTAGEAFDKVAKLLGLSWPGGPALEMLAAGGDPFRFAFPRPMFGRDGCDFSFSGLKTAVGLTVAQLGNGSLAHTVAADIAASFQRVVADVLAERVCRAMMMMRARKGGKLDVLVVSGGVAANGAIRAAIQAAADSARFRLVLPPPSLCTDNAVMVAWAAFERLRHGRTDELETEPRPRWDLQFGDQAANRWQ